MSIETHSFNIGGIDVELVRKKIKNIHFGVYPPDGRVRIAVPLALNNEAAHLAIIDKLGWIKRHRAKFQEQPRQSKRELVSGESHYFLGQRYLLRVIEHNATPKINVRGINYIDFYIRPNTSKAKREAILDAWYREQLREIIPPIIQKWQKKLGVEPLEWRIKKMKTKWGTCNVTKKRIWLNLELVKKPMECVEYVVLHELAHLIEPSHNARFKAILDTHQSRWKEHRNLLNSLVY